jgi:hypothetical protein
VEGVPTHGNFPGARRLRTCRPSSDQPVQLTGLHVELVLGDAQERLFLGPNRGRFPVRPIGPWVRPFAFAKFSGR